MCVAGFARWSTDAWATVRKLLGALVALGLNSVATWFEMGSKVGPWSEHASSAGQTQCGAQQFENWFEPGSNWVCDLIKPSSNAV